MRNHILGHIERTVLYLNKNRLTVNRATRIVAVAEIETVFSRKKLDIDCGCSVFSARSSARVALMKYQQVLVSETIA